jgi:hypothetical protein
MEADPASSFRRREAGRLREQEGQAGAAGVVLPAGAAPHHVTGASEVGLGELGLIVWGNPGHSGPPEVRAQDARSTPTENRPLAVENPTSISKTLY